MGVSYVDMTRGHESLSIFPHSVQNLLSVRYPSSVSKTKTQFCKNCVFVLPVRAMRGSTQNHGFIFTAVKINAHVLGRRLLIITPWRRNYIVRRFEPLTKAKQLAFYRAS